MSDGEHQYAVLSSAPFRLLIRRPGQDVQVEQVAGDGWRRQPGLSELDLKILWDDLACGKLAIRSVEHTEQRCSLTVERLGRAPGIAPLMERRLRILQRVLLGESPKEIAYALDLAVSTIALACRDCLETMGAKTCSLRSPLALVMAAHAAAGVECAKATMREHQSNPEMFVVSVERLDLRLASKLSAAEYQVVRLLVEGYAYAQMAELRGGSVRTIANQIASAFRKLGVSGRSSMMASLVRDYGGLDARRRSHWALPCAGSYARRRMDPNQQ